MKKTIACSLLLLLASAGSAFAQAQFIPKDETLKGAGDEDLEGWNPALAGTATVNVVSNSNVVGQVDGFSTLVGLGVVGGADWVHAKQVLRLTASVSESFARTPVVDEFTKTADVVAIEGLYNYFLSSKAGLFGRLQLTTSAFAANDVRSTPTTWVEKDPDGGMATVLSTGGTRQKLAGSFAPFSINQSAGGFFEPLSGEKLSLSVRLGVGGRETFASKVLLIDDDSATPEVELLRLSNVYQAGLEAFAGASGKAKDGKLTYKAGLAFLMPFLNNDEYDRGAAELARIALEGNVSFNVYEWMSLVYSLAITKDAQLFPKGSELTQIQNNLLLTFKYNFVEKKKKDKAPTPEELELAAAKTRADEADKAKAAAEAKVLELEQKLSAADAACADKCAAAPAPAPAPAPATAPAPAPAPATR
jgi:hypothetical protein